MDETLGSFEVDSKYENEIEPIKNKLRVFYYVENVSFKNDLIILFATFFLYSLFLRKKK